MTFEFLDPVLRILPEVRRPAKAPPFKRKVMWVVAALLIFFVLGEISPYGLLSPERYDEIVTRASAGNEDALQKLQLIEQTGSPEQVAQRIGFLENVQTILASKMGTLATLGIGPIVMASIILQLLSGAELIELEKERYQGVQKMFAILFCFFEASIYVVTGFLPIEPTGLIVVPLINMDLNAFLVMNQIAMGSVILLFLDEVVSKWGFGSGIGLFIVGGVSQSVVYRALNPNTGLIPQFMNEMIQVGTMDIDLMFPVIFTIVVFAIVVFVEAMRVEIPLTLGRIRGVGGRYPLKFLYVSNIPVILAAALFANMQLFANVFAGAGYPILGTFDLNGQPTAQFSLGPGLNEIVFPVAYFVKAPYGLLGSTTAFDRLLNPTEFLFGIPLDIVHLIVYLIILIATCIVFGQFWVETTGMGPSKVAEQLQNVGFSVPGFRRDRRVIERVLRRYIPIITILGAAAVGMLAGLADITGALGTGTGILLSVGILYRLYEELASAQLAEMHPALKTFLG
jgi:preprotein translocase subunit SecY